MQTHRDSARRIAAMGALLVAQLSVAFATPALASPLTTDPRWLPWIGCWAPSAATTDVAAALVATQRVCIMPAEGSTGVDVVSLVNGEVVSRVRVDANGERRAVSREGCEGWETARWSAAAGRVYLRSELVCAGGVDRKSTGVIAIASPSDWVDVEVVTVLDQRATRVVRYRSAPDTAGVDREIAAALGTQEMARRAARMAASALPTIADVIEASRHLDAATVEAWLLQRMPRFTVSARELRQLADAHVPGSTIDAVVALSRPELFHDRIATRGYTVVRLDAPRSPVVSVEPTMSVDQDATSPVVWIDGGGYTQRYSRRDRCDRCNDSRYDDYYYDPTPYGYYYYPYWPYGSYPVYPRHRPEPEKPASRPPVIVHGPAYEKPTPAPAPQPAPEQVNGRAVNGRGYTRSGGTTAEPTQPAAQPAPRQAAPPSTPEQYAPRRAAPPEPQRSAPEQAAPRRAEPRYEPSPSAPPPQQSRPAAQPASPPANPPRPEAKPAEPPPAPKPEAKQEPPPRTAKTRPPSGA